MNNKNIISNKFDLNWSTMFSYSIFARLDNFLGDPNNKKERGSLLNAYCYLCWLLKLHYLILQFLIFLKAEYCIIKMSLHKLFHSLSFRCDFLDIGNVCREIG